VSVLGPKPWTGASAEPVELAEGRWLRRVPRTAEPAGRWCGCPAAVQVRSGQPRCGEAGADETGHAAARPNTWLALVAARCGSFPAGASPYREDQGYAGGQPGSVQAQPDRLCGPGGLRLATRPVTGVTGGAGAAGGALAEASCRSRANLRCFLVPETSASLHRYSVGNKIWRSGL
jgi:hypothetical protein